MKCKTCKGTPCADCGKEICMHTGKNWGGKTFWHATATRLCRTCCEKRAIERLKELGIVTQ